MKKPRTIDLGNVGVIITPKGVERDISPDDVVSHHEFDLLAAVSRACAASIMYATSRDGSLASTVVHLALKCGRTAHIYHDGEVCIGCKEIRPHSVARLAKLVEKYRKRNEKRQPKRHA